MADIKIENKEEVKKSEAKTVKTVKAKATEMIRSSYGAWNTGDIFEIASDVFENWKEHGICEKAE